MDEAWMWPVPADGELVPDHPPALFGHITAATLFDQTIAYTGPGVLIHSDRAWTVGVRLSYRENTELELGALPALTVMSPELRKWHLVVNVDDQAAVTHGRPAIVRCPGGLEIDTRHIGDVDPVYYPGDAPISYDLTMVLAGSVPSRIIPGNAATCRNCQHPIIRGAGDEWFHAPDSRSLQPTCQPPAEPTPA